jgi:hypothetical protein
MAVPAAVLELYGKRRGVHGWAGNVKSQGESAGGRGWYEVLSTEDDSRTLAADAGGTACTECHVKGCDFVSTPDPLR